MAAINVIETLSFKENSGESWEKGFGFFDRKVWSDAITLFEKSLPYKEFIDPFETVDKWKEDPVWNQEL